MLVPSSGRFRRALLSVFSCLFYAAWDWRYLGLLLLIGAIDFVAARQIHQSNRPQARRAWLVLSVVSNLGILAYFKYVNFFLKGLVWVGLLPQALHWDVVLPLGISFYTFKSLSYTIDVYRRSLTPCSNWLDYALFVSFFPDLIAGPIVRASVFLPQLQRSPGLEVSRTVVGLNVFLQGLTKKILVADRLGEIVDPVFACPQAFSSGSVAMAFVAYAGQIYCDFSGYSDMAIGTARILGYDLPMNFNLPYLSRNLIELWQRWHITLTTWLRDYCYLSLGGNRRPLTRYRNLMITMTLTGFWHGASLNFLAWGAVNGLAVCFLHQTRAWRWKPLPFGLAWFLTIGFWILSAGLFRGRSVAQILGLYQKLLLYPDPHGQELFPHWFVVCLLLIALGHVLSASSQKATPPRGWQTFLTWTGLSVVELPLAGRYLCFTRPTVAGAYLVSLWLGLLLFFAATTANAFIYFQF